MIVVENRRTYKRETNEKCYRLVEYIGRPSIWGNPYKAGVHGNREEVIRKYLGWLREQYKMEGMIYEELNELARYESEGWDIVLVCWCKPLDCHGDVLKMAIEKIAKTLP